MRIGAWVTDREGDQVLHVGLHGTPMKYARDHYTVQEAIDCLTASNADHEEKTGIAVDFSNPFPAHPNPGDTGGGLIK